MKSASAPTPKHFIILPINKTRKEQFKQNNQNDINVIKSFMNFDKLSVGCDLNNHPFKMFENKYKNKNYSSFHSSSIFEYFNWEVDEFFDLSSNNVSFNYSNSTTIMVNDENEENLHINNNSVFLQVSLVPTERGKNTFYLTLINHYKLLKTLLENYMNYENPFFYLKFSQLLDSLITLIWNDIVKKWFHWYKMVKRYSTDTKTLSDITTLYSLQTILNTKFYSKHFLIRDAKDCSIDKFNHLLENPELAKQSHISQNENSHFPIPFGIWIDCEHGIIIFANSVNDHTIPNERICFTTCAYCFHDIECHLIVKKIILFFNLALLQCFKQEVV